MSEVATLGAGTLASFIERASRDETFSLEKFRELILMQREAEERAARHEFNIAMSRVQAEIQTIGKDRDNPATRSKYATFQAIDAVARPKYTEHGFSIRFGTGPAPLGWVRVTCELAHVGGHSESHHLDGPLDSSGAQGRTNKTGIQAIGSTVSYLRRYLMLLVLNLVTVDDDDNDGEGLRDEFVPVTKQVPLNKAAAADMPRAPKVTEKPEAPERTEEQWRVWVDKLRAACFVLYSRQEVVEIGERASVGEALAKGPPWVQREISAILAENFKRFPDEEPEPEAEELPDLEIANADKLAG